MMLVPWRLGACCQHTARFVVTCYAHPVNEVRSHSTHISISDHMWFRTYEPHRRPWCWASHHVALGQLPAATGLSPSNTFMTDRAMGLLLRIWPALKCWKEIAWLI